jgi:uncharacterized protein
VDLVEVFFNDVLQFIDEHGTPWVRELDHMTRAMLASAAGPIGNTLTEPLSILSIDSKGNWYTFCPELTALGSAWSFGNLSTHSELLWKQNERLLSVNGEIKAGVERCRRECEYFPVCGGGAPSNKFFENGSFECSETKSCKTLTQPLARATMKHLLATLRTSFDGETAGTAPDASHA